MAAEFELRHAADEIGHVSYRSGLSAGESDPGFSPAEGSNNKSHPEKTPEMLEMLYHFNDDDDPSSSNRCNEPELSLLKNIV